MGFTSFFTTYGRDEEENSTLILSIRGSFKLCWSIQMRRWPYMLISCRKSCDNDGGTFRGCWRNEGYVWQYIMVLLIMLLFVSRISYHKTWMKSGANLLSKKPNTYLWLVAITQHYCIARYVERHNRLVSFWLQFLFSASSVSQQMEIMNNYPIICMFGNVWQRLALIVSS